MYEDTLESEAFQSDYSYFEEKAIDEDCYEFEQSIKGFKAQELSLDSFRALMPYLNEDGYRGKQARLKFTEWWANARKQNKPLSLKSIPYGS